MSLPLPSGNSIPQRKGDFPTILAALDYAATGETGLDFYDVRGNLTAGLPYRQLRSDALDLARRLLSLGLGRGARVALVAETSPDFVRAFFACLYAGLVPAPVPLPAALGGRQAYLAHIGKLAIDSRASVLLAPATVAAWFEPVAESMGLRLCGTVASLAELTPSDEALPVAGPDDLAYLQFSSGSTRAPAGVAVVQKALMANVAGILTHGLRARPGDRAMSWLPLYHDMGLVGFLLASLGGQITVDFLATQDFARRPQLWLSLISERRATISYSPSFGYELCIRRAEQVASLGLDLSCWRVAGIGGDMIRPEVLRRFTAIFAGHGFDTHAFMPSYGMAEATLALTFTPEGQGLEVDEIDVDRMEHDEIAVVAHGGSRRRRRVVLCGTPIPGTELAIRDAEGRVLGERRIGRIFARGPSLMAGYDGRPEETVAILSPEGWLDTGDLGYWLAGQLVITGRAKDLIIINGRNIWPQDLEWSVEQAVPEIRSGKIAAFSIEDEGEEIVVIAAEARPSAGAAEDLERTIAGALRAQHGIAGRVVLLPPGALPYTSSGKLSRTAARQRYLTGTLLPQVERAA